MSIPVYNLNRFLLSKESLPESNRKCHVESNQTVAHGLDPVLRGSSHKPEGNRENQIPKGCWRAVNSAIKKLVICRVVQNYDRALKATAGSGNIQGCGGNFGKSGVFSRYAFSAQTSPETFLGTKKQGQPKIGVSGRHP